MEFVALRADRLADVGRRHARARLVRVEAVRASGAGRAGPVAARGGLVFVEVLVERTDTVGVVTRAVEPSTLDALSARSRVVQPVSLGVPTRPVARQAGLRRGQYRASLSAPRTHAFTRLAEVVRLARSNVFARVSAVRRQAGRDRVEHRCVQAGVRPSRQRLDVQLTARSGVDGLAVCADQRRFAVLERLSASGTRSATVEVSAIPRQVHSAMLT